MSVIDPVGEVEPASLGIIVGLEIVLLVPLELGLVGDQQAVPVITDVESDLMSGFVDPLATRIDGALESAAVWGGARPHMGRPAQAPKD